MLKLANYLSSGRYDEALTILQENRQILNNKLKLNGTIVTPLQAFAMAGEHKKIEQILELAPDITPGRRNENNALAAMIGSLEINVLLMKIKKNINRLLLYCY